MSSLQLCSGEACSFAQLQSITAHWRTELLNSCQCEGPAVVACCCSHDAHPLIIAVLQGLCQGLQAAAKVLLVLPTRQKRAQHRKGA